MWGLAFLVLVGQVAVADNEVIAQAPLGSASTPRIDPKEDLWVEGAGEYFVGPNTTPQEAERGSHQQARRDAVEKAVGTWIMGTTVIRNYQLASDLVQTMVRSIQLKEKSLKKLVDNSKERSVADFIWKDPLMVAGRGTFINEMLKLNKFNNVFSEKRYPETSFDELKNLNPEICLLSSEPYPFKDKHIPEFEESGAKVLIVDGESFSWYGSRLLKAMDYFKQFHS